MGNLRKTPRDTKRSHLLDEVGGLCPFCSASLLPTKNGKALNAYEITHIWPVNPTLIQMAELTGLTAPLNINGDENLLATCVPCHKKFDKYFTKDLYHEWVSVKKRLLQKRNNKQLFFGFGIEEEVNQVIQSLIRIENINADLRLDFRALKVSQKIGNKLPYIAKKDIEDNIVDYFQYIRDLFTDIDKTMPFKFETVALQVKTFYVKCKQESNSYNEIFEHLVSWLHHKTSKQSEKACEIIISFFIQNCEVFSDSSQ